MRTSIKILFVIFSFTVYTACERDARHKLENNNQLKNIVVKEIKSDTISEKIKYKKRHLPLDILEDVIVTGFQDTKSLIVDRPVIYVKRQEAYHSKATNLNFYRLSFATGGFCYGFYQDKYHITYFPDQLDYIYLFSDFILINNNKNYQLKILGFEETVDPRDDISCQYDTIFYMNELYAKKEELLCFTKKYDKIWKVCKNKKNLDMFTSELDEKEEKGKLLSISRQKGESLINSNMNLLDSLQTKIFPTNTSFSNIFLKGYKLKNYDIYIVKIKSDIKNNSPVYFNILFKGNKILKIYESIKKENLMTYQIHINNENDFKIRLTSNFFESIGLEYYDINDKLTRGQLYYFYKQNGNSSIGFIYTQ